MGRTVPVDMPTTAPAMTSVGKWLPASTRETPTSEAPERAEANLTYTF